MHTFKKGTLKNEIAVSRIGFYKAFTEVAFPRCSLQCPAVINQHGIRPKPHAYCMPQDGEGFSLLESSGTYDAGGSLRSEG